MGDEVARRGGLVPAGERGLARRSSDLAKRGLELLDAQRARTIRFPDGWGIGMLYARNRGDQSEKSWVEFGLARGTIAVPQELELKLRIDQEAEFTALEEFEARPLLDRNLCPLTNLAADALHTLELGPALITDNGLSYVSGLGGLRELSLWGANLTFNDLMLVSTGFAVLKNANDITDAGLAHLRPLTELRKLDLSYCQITDAGLHHLAGMMQLRGLNLSSTIADARAHLPHLSSITDAGLADLRPLTGLQKLDLVDCQITDAGLHHLTGLTQLQELDLSLTDVTATGVQLLRHALPHCEIKFSGLTE